MKGRTVHTATASGSGPAPRPERAAGQLFEQFRTGLYRYLLRRLRSADNAEDLAQEVYLRLLRAADLEQVRCPQAYVYRIAANVLYEFRLRERSARVLFDSTAMSEAMQQLTDDSAQPEKAYEDSARSDRFERLIAQLAPMQRAVLQLATQHQLAHAQIAEKLGISISTVRNHLYKAIDHCRHRCREES